MAVFCVISNLVIILNGSSSIRMSRILQWVAVRADVMAPPETHGIVLPRMAADYSSDENGLVLPRLIV